MAIYFSRMPDIDITPMLPRITAPTLALTGDRDPVVPPAQARVIAEAVPDGTHAVLEGNIGHFPFYESPTPYQNTIKGWLKHV
jgi:pimeloyl-ACP methyl ester carboxylesterase